MGTPIKKIDPPMLDPRSPGVSLPILGQIGPAVWPSIKDKKQADRKTNISVRLIALYCDAIYLPYVYRGLTVLCFLLRICTHARTQIQTENT